MYKFKVSILSFFLALALFSCNKNEVIPDTSDLASAANLRTAGDSTKTNVLVADLPAAITAYISSNYVGATISSAHLESDGNYDVIITTSAGVVSHVYFTPAGVFVSERVGGNCGKDGKGGKGGHGKSGKGGHGKGNNGIDVALADLPAAITSYITNNYAGATINSAHTEANGNYDVIITTTDGTKSHVYFTADGVFVKAV